MERQLLYQQPQSSKLAVNAKDNLCVKEGVPGVAAARLLEAVTPVVMAEIGVKAQEVANNVLGAVVEGIDDAKPREPLTQKRVVIVIVIVTVAPLLIPKKLLVFKTK